MISILIPVYNSEKWIKECLDSIINQSDSNYEVVIIDDGSKDKSLNICNEYKNKCEMRIYSRENKGVTFTRNELVNLAKGEYFLFLDSDDLLDINIIYYLNKIINDNSYLDAVLYDVKHFYNVSLINNKKNIYYESYLKKEAIEDYLTLKRRGYIAGLLINRNFWKELGIIFQLEKYIEDWYPMFFYIANCHTIYYLHGDLYLYRQQIDSAISNSGLNIIKNYNDARLKIKNYSKNILNINDKYINCFMVKTDLDIIHELAKLELNILQYSKYYCCGTQKIFKTLINDTLNKYEKIKYILFKFKIYEFFKKVKNINGY